MCESASHALPQLLSIQAAPAASLTDAEGVWVSGIHKQPVQGPVRVNREGLVGDGQADREHHGGIDKAVLAYAVEHYGAWQRQLGIATIPHGGFGENLSLGGIDEDGACLGDIWQIDEVQLQISQPRQPCWKLGRRWNLNLLPKLVVQSRQTGWYYRVLEPGTMSSPAPMLLQDRLHPSWTIRTCNDVFYDGRPAARRELAGIRELSDAWKRQLQAT